MPSTNSVLNGRELVLPHFEHFLGSGSIIVMAAFLLDSTSVSNRPSRASAHDSVRPENAYEPGAVAHSPGAAPHASAPSLASWAVACPAPRDCRSAPAAYGCRRRPTVHLAVVEEHESHGSSGRVYVATLSPIIAHMPSVWLYISTESYSAWGASKLLDSII